MPSGITIDPALIDVEFRFDGYKPSSDDKHFGVEFPESLIIPRNEWKDKYDELVENDTFNGPHPKGCIVANYCPFVFDQTPESSCFPPGTRIRMADGSNKPIEEIRLFDRVLTAERNIGTVTHLFGRQHDEGLLQIKLAGRSDGLKLTAEHPVLIRDGGPGAQNKGTVWNPKSVPRYVKAKDIRKGMFVALPRYMATGSRVLQTEPHLMHRQRHYATRESYGKFKIGVGGEIGNQELMVQLKIRVPDVIDLDAAAGRIFGLFLAEGSTNRGAVTWSFNIKEKDTLVKELVELLRDAWGAEARVQVRKGNNTCKVHLQGVQWARLFESLCSCHGGAKNKRVHSDLLGAGQEFLEALLFGWLDGDGCYGKEKDELWDGVTISRDLALTMYDIAQALGFNPRIQKCYPKVSHGVKFRQPRYDVKFEAEPTVEDRRFFRREDKHVWRRVRDIEAVEYSGRVYNFEVSGDNSYVADGFGVHNCVFNAAAGVLMRLWCMHVGMQHAVILSPMSGYCQVATSRHSGSYMMDALELTSTWGLLPSSEHGQKDKFKHTFHENTPFVRKSSLPDGCEETAIHFRVKEWLRIENEIHFGSALLNQFPICYGRDGHSICGEDMVFKSGSADPLCRSCDSYRFKNRDGTGRIYDSMRKWAAGGAWAGRTSTVPHDPAHPTA